MLWLENLPEAPDDITLIDIMMIVSPENLDDYDDVVMPASEEDIIIRQIIDLISKKPRPDTLNDQNDQNAIQ
jgi:hypothetical protein